MKNQKSRGVSIGAILFVPLGKYDGGAIFFSLNRNTTTTTQKQPRRATLMLPPRRGPRLSTRPGGPPYLPPASPLAEGQTMSPSTPALVVEDYQDILSSSNSTLKNSKSSSKQSSSSSSVKEFRTITVDVKDPRDHLTHQRIDEIKRELAECVAELSTEPFSPYANHSKTRESKHGKRMLRNKLEVEQSPIKSFWDLRTHANQLLGAYQCQLDGVVEKLRLLKQQTDQLKDDISRFPRIMELMMLIQEQNRSEEMNILVEQLDAAHNEICMLKDQLRNASPTITTNDSSPSHSARMSPQTQELDNDAAMNLTEADIAHFRGLSSPLPSPALPSMGREVVDAEEEQMQIELSAPLKKRRTIMTPEDLSAYLDSSS